jgi:hypothetical protein
MLVGYFNHNSRTWGKPMLNPTESGRAIAKRCCVCLSMVRSSKAQSVNYQWHFTTEQQQLLQRYYDIP